MNGDIRNIEDCRNAVRDCEYVFHQAALGSVPRSIKDPVTTNSVNIDGFLNMLTVSRDEQVKRFIYAASSSTYGDGSFSRDFTYIDNVIQANELSALATKRQILDGIRNYFSQKPAGYTLHLAPRTLHPDTVFVVFNIAYGGNTTLNALFEALRHNLAKFDPKIEKINAIYGPERSGDIPHSLASIEKARKVLGYDPKYNAEKGFEMACGWYFENLK